MAGRHRNPATAVSALPTGSNRRPRVPGNEGERQASLNCTTVMVSTAPGDTRTR